MVENASFLPKSNLAASLLGIIALVLIVSTWTGRRLPLINNDRLALILLLVIGYLVGVLILIVAGSALFHLPFLWITSERAAILTIGTLVALKWVNAMVFYLFFNRPA